MKPLATVVWFVLLGQTGLAAVWFMFRNFLSDELYHPLDFYSNKLRTRPHYLALVLGVLGGGAVLILFSGILWTVFDTLPELGFAVQLQALVLGAVMIVRESAAAGLVATALNAFVAAGTARIATIPDMPSDQPGVFYSGAYLILGMIFAEWMRVGAERHVDHDGEKSPLPPGAERLPQLWAKTVRYGNPALLVVTNLVFLELYMLEQNEYGWGCAILFYVVAAVLLFGCCYRFRAGTEVEV